ncbi:sugar phosphate isomerase/epimerase family protein [Pseudoramibacter sp.]|jgi:sugar phosphate isomerase/epimerase|uniref:sugar phosphate isomerase/epimerase family protein n=1 Tax=Pseudoramibacter sp. TaxID=2034862 RepID=UPI0025EE2B29|nr:TIM barrel protein [Pseudoramibacter sp.]MCH4072113.1 sugar phosphate isomerase/epimerase [Pseudoramibacter sp.]MCH4105883.1 sugar phosphate isomerase/epimerase [Pseudoramibacter sp.]
MLKGKDRKFKLGLHSYTLHLSGFGESWGFQSEGKTYAFEKTHTLTDLMDLAVKEGIEVLHITLVDLDNDLSPEHLAQVKKDAEDRGIELELNISFNAPSDPRVNSTIEESLEIAHQIGAKLVKYSTDVEHPHPISHACMCPEAMEQISKIILDFKKNIPTIEKYGMQIAIENHCDLFSDEVIYMVKQLHHPLIGACCDTINSLMLAEGIEECVRKMAPYVNCVHFCDNRVFADPDGTHSLGCAIGDGDVDVVEVMKILREQAPPELDTIDLEIELPLSGYSIEEGRQLELDEMRKSIKFMKENLGIGTK